MPPEVSGRATSSIGQLVGIHATPIMSQVEDVEVVGAGALGGGGAGPGGSTNHRQATIQLNQHTLTAD